MIFAHGGRLSPSLTSVLSQDGASGRFGGGGGGAGIFMCLLVVSFCSS